MIFVVSSSAHGVKSSEPTENGPAQHGCRTGIDLMVDADGFAGGIQPWNNLSIAVDDLSVGVHLDATEGEAIARNDRKCAERFRLDLSRPV